MNILILGSGGREHALARKIAESTHCERLFVAPGNAGTTQIATNVPVSPTDFEQVSQLIIQESIGLVVVGPEDPLVKGIRDFLEAKQEHKNLKLVGPGQMGAQLEGSKDFSKRFMQRHQIPTAKYQTFTVSTLADGLKYLESMSLPIVLKADGLAAGKGVLIVESLEEAKTSLKEMLVDQKFGAASAQVVVEEFLTGIELSVFVLTDGQHYVTLPEAKDYKRIGDNDTGLNTGGMGAVSPVVFADAAFMKKVEERVIKPTIQGLHKESIPYKGFVFIGLMNVKGEPFVIEYNVRMGDPETEVVIPRIESDLVELLLACAEGKMEQAQLRISPKTATTVMMVAEGYPGEYEKGKIIKGWDTPTKAYIYHAGTKLNNQEVVTNGGRVMTATGMGNTLDEALRISYEAVNQICWEGITYRKDIGKDLQSLVVS